MKRYDIYRKPVFRNNLDEIMTKNNISSSYLSRISGISRSTIYRIRMNPYNKTTSYIKNKICESLNIQKEKFGEKVEYAQMMFEKIGSVDFNEKNISQFKKILYDETKGFFQIDPYSRNSCINIKMKWRRKNTFLGNIRITMEDGELVFKIIDFDFKYYEKELFDSIVKSFELYAKYIGVKYIVFSPGVLYNTYNKVREPIRELLNNKYIYYYKYLKNNTLLDEDKIYKRFINKSDRIYGFSKFVTY
ncbi:MAG: helix-turn-helix transcriptional regulator [Bifidobacteriales bacterium]|nr:helix-turn-helix transcriptional regulator [Bifidobacteriales bacterium]